MNRFLEFSAICVLSCALFGCDAATGTTANIPPDPGSSTSLPDDTSGTGSGEVAEAGVTQKPAEPEKRKSSDEADANADQESNGLPQAGEIEDVSFDDLRCNMQQDIVFRPFMLTDRVKELDGQRIRVAGYMLPDLKQKGIEEFVLLKNTECKFGPGGQADHLIMVKLQNGVTATYRGEKPIEVVGTLKINPFEGPDGNTWSIFDMIGESVGPMRRR